MDNLPFKETDLASFAGLALVIPMLIGGLKKLWPDWITGKEPHICLALTYALGVVSKLTVPGAFGGVSWPVVLLGLFFTAIGASQVHDFFVNKVVKGKMGPPDQPDGPRPGDAP